MPDTSVQTAVEKMTEFDVMRFRRHSEAESTDEAAAADKENCLLWTSRKRNGYGRFKIRGEYYQAHQVAYCLANNRIPEDADVISHTCSTRACVNPNHLAAKSREEMYAEQAERQGTRPSDHIGSGEDHPATTHSDETLRRLRIEYASEDVSIRDLGEKYDMSPGYISRVLNYEHRPDAGPPKEKYMEMYKK